MRHIYLKIPYPEMRAIRYVYFSVVSTVTMVLSSLFCGLANDRDQHKVSWEFVIESTEIFRIVSALIEQVELITYCGILYYFIAYKTCEISYKMHSCIRIFRKNLLLYTPYLA